MENLYFLGITEKYNESVEFFNRISQTSVPSLTLNKNPKIENFIQNLPQSTLDLVVENNALDLELYKAGVQLFERRLSESKESNKTVTYVNFYQKISHSEVRKIWLRHKPQPLYNKSLNLTLIFCAKSACSFGVKWFFYHAGLYQEVESYHRFPHRYRSEVFTQDPQYKKHIREVDGILNSNIVCLVRDPFSRAVSSYIHAIKTGYDDRAISKFLGRKIGRKNSFCFDEFVQYLKSLDIRNCNIHHRLQAHPLIEMGIIKPYILKVENLFNDFQEVEKKLGLNPSPLSQISKSLEFHRTPKDSTFKKECYHIQFSGARKQLFPHYKYFYSEELVRDIANIYRADFEIFGYKPELDLELTSQAPSQPSLTQIEKDMLKWRDDLNKIRG
ncbi:sulfotransferase family 2 domain-containing protein [Limnospira platensis]|uniref:sulfotransferase family 2 domain-containing protein n=1 Tax=Limnospira platensis TaxID=118562 RepID=UPI003D6F172F